MVFNSTNEKVPHFNAPAYLENKTQIGKVDEVFGPTTKVVSYFSCMCAARLKIVKMFTVKPTEGVVAGSFKLGDKVYISDQKLLPMSRFLPQAYV